MSARPNAFVDAIAAYVPGEAAIDGVAEPARLAANESAFGPSPAAMVAHAAAAAAFERYPDPDCTALRRAIGARYGLDPARIVCGAGSDEIITLLCRAYAGPGDPVLHSRHGFLMYPIAAAGVGAAAVAAPETDLRADVDALLAAAGPRTKLCFLANPNTPTGSYLPADEIARLRDGLPADCLLA
ncbi:MAG: aminotransferase class I/II-fold pyridoxal phosphate-dependent enzyme, partial [Pseudomonadota bacterium]